MLSHFLEADSPAAAVRWR